MSEESPRDRFAECATRLAKAYGPVAALTLQYQKQTGSSVTMSAGDLLRGAITGIATKFVTQDGQISALEAEALEPYMPGPGGLKDLAVALDGIKGGQLFDSVSKLGSGEKQMVHAIAMLRTVAGSEAAEELAEAAKELAMASCELDGRDPEEDRALAEFSTVIDEALASS